MISKDCLAREHSRAQEMIGYQETKHNQQRDKMTGYLTTHVLDTARGQPARGMQVVLFRLSGSERTEIARLFTNDDGRTDSQILPAADFETGMYELEFHAGDWMDATGIAPESPRFLDIIPIRFGMSQQDHYHVPLLISPFGYSTYRGS
jgi:5-hydroxyisourate hydrolase